MTNLSTQILNSCFAIAPELILIGTMLVVLLWDMSFLNKGNSWKCGWLAIAGMAFASVWLFKIEASQESVFNGALVRNAVALFFQKIFLFGAMAVAFFSVCTGNLRNARQGEYYCLLLAATLGAMFLAAANDFVMLMLSLETLSLSSYVLAGYLRFDRESSESSMKYILYGAVASGIMLFGISYIYGMTGSLKIDLMFLPIADGKTPVVLYVALMMIFAGVGFKISAVPFHNWTPDVYEGSPTPVTTYLAVVSKAAGFAILIRLLFQSGGLNEADSFSAASQLITSLNLDILFLAASIATMTVGNLVAIRQTDIKRLLGYSSIAHAGYLLMAFVVLTPEAFDAALFYFVIYYLMTLGAFLVTIVIENHLGSSEISACRGLWITSPYLVAAMVVFMVSLTGLPPTAGFIAKFRLFMAVVNAGLGEGARGSTLYFALVFIAVMNSVVSLYYYFKIIKAMALEPFQKAAMVRLRALEAIPIALLAISVLVLGLYFAPVSRFVRTAFVSAQENSIYSADTSLQLTFLNTEN